ncbi:MAG TPA: phage tail tube protein [Ramlibacter sp.]|jgi:hypothetical protein|nr:phage tail tube protein [Ramlibacter sp.]
MATRYIRNTVVLLKDEVTYGLDPTPTGAANAMLVSGLSITPLNAQNVPRELVFGYMGGFQHLVGNRFVECGFDIELVGSGTAGTAPAWGPALKACGFSETVTATTRVDYVPVSTGFGSCTIYWYDDGLLHKLTGARGNVSFRLGAGGRPTMSFTFRGLYNAPTAASNATPTITAFKVPEVVAEANTADLTLGATHTLAIAPALTAGTTYPSLGLEFSPNNTVEHIPLLGGESVDITGRDASCSFQLDLTAAQEVTLMASVAAATLTSVGLVHGSTAGFKSLVFLPYVQPINPRKSEVSGKRMVSFDGRVTPSAGNDEMRIVTF